MACCEPTIVPFSNASSSSIAYSPGLSAIYGSQPKVFVLYRDADTGEYVVASWFTRIAYSGGNINIDHGGEQTGLVVIE